MAEIEREHRRAFREELGGLGPMADPGSSSIAHLYGHERPSIVIGSLDAARAHSLALDKEAERIIAGPNQGTDRRAEIALQRTIEAREPAMNPTGIGPVMAADQRMQSEVLRSWLGADVVGPLVHDRLAASPPVLSTESLGLMERLSERYAVHDIEGLYIPDSNHILIAADVPLEADRRRIMVHEDLHYASWLGGGMDGVRYIDDTQGPVTVRGLTWMHEGTTELLAQELTRAHGETPSFVAYPESVMTAFYMERVLSLATGSDAQASSLLRQAYVSGDYAEVGRLMDSKLGEGTFATLIGQRQLPGGGFVDGGPMAFFYLEGRITAAGLDTAGWQSQGIPAAIDRQMMGN